MNDCRMTVLVTAALLVAAPVLAAGPPDGVSGNPTVGEAVRTGESPVLRDLSPEAPIPVPPRPIPNRVDFQPPGQGPTVAGPDPLRQTDASGPTTSAATTPAPILSFEGTTDDDNAAVVGGRVVPPDTEGDVGPNHYVQMNNLIFEIFDKSGNSVLGPLANNSLWAGFGGICEENNDGDPIVLYDQGADRWILSQFAIGDDGHQCVAVSQTSDPTGAYFLYDFNISPNCFNDYPKMGVWPDGYYLTANEFCSGGGPFGQSFRSAIAVAFEKPAMINGQAASFAKFDIDTPDGDAFSVQPSHWEGPTAPDTGRPNVFGMAFDSETWGSSGAADGYQLWEFAVDWANDSFSFTHLGQADTAEFDADLCSFSACVPQPDSGELLDTLSQFTMFRLHYRNTGSHETLVANHSVDADGNDTAGVRWAELRNGGSGWSVHQAGTYAPADGEHRWMGSATMDGSGNIAVAYSLSSSNTFPSVMYNTRAPGDPAGELTGGEVTCHAGAGVQESSSNRWGDYSTISVDPVDDCTFWLTNEYYQESGSFDFKTRICAFTLDSCGSCTVTEDPETSCSDGVDNDCDGLTDADDPDCCPDADGDGFSDASCGGTDCNDSDPAINPSASEDCTDGVDNDCDGDVDCADSDCSGTCACDPDADGDGFEAEACGGTDCNDSDANINPGAVEICDDGIDNDCDDTVDCDDGDCSSDPACDTSCLSKGASCTSDSECCSNKCRGRAGAMTCKGN